MTNEKPSLESLRAEIDHIDNQLHDLIMQRSTIIERVRQAKASDRIKIRPAREADILYRLSDRHHGVFPKQSLFRMWREMIVGTLALEAPFSVAVLAAHGDDGDHGYEDLARDHFGSFSNLQFRTSTTGIIDLVAGGEATVGVLPYPDAEAPDMWWDNLHKHEGPKPFVMGRLPFFGRSNAKGAARNAMVISAVEPEPSERDVSVYRFEPTSGGVSSGTSAGISEGFMQTVEAALNDAGLKPVLLFRTGHSVYVELSGFIAVDDGRLATVSETASGMADWLGVYSVPIDHDELDAVAEATTP